MGIYDRDYYQDDQFRPMRPWDNRSMVTLLIFANIAVFVANFLFTARTGELSRFLSLDATTLTNPVNWWQYVTYGFVHDYSGGFPRHILFNMLSLYFLGRSVEEDKLGKWEFFRFYMVTLILCGILWSGLHYGEPTHLLGASGAVTAVVMLFVFHYPQATVQLFFAIPVKAWVLGVLVIVSNLFSTTAMGENGEPRVAVDVHLIGAAFAAAYFYGRWNFGGIGRFFAGFKQAAKVKRSGLKVHDPKSTAPPSKDEEEMDRLLRKITAEGEESLTKKERKFMERYSREVRKRRAD